VFLTVQEAGRTLQISRTRVYDLVRTQQLRSRKIGRVRRIPVDAIREFVAQADEEVA
jgi:excisionase family DNA binding protein